MMQKHSPVLKKKHTFNEFVVSFKRIIKNVFKMFIVIVKNLSG